MSGWWRMPKCSMMKYNILLIADKYKIIDNWYVAPDCQRYMIE